MSTTESASPASAPEPMQEPAPKKSSIGKRILTYVGDDCAVVSGTSTSP